MKKLLALLTAFAMAFAAVAAMGEADSGPQVYMLTIENLRSGHNEEPEKTYSTIVEAALTLPGEDRWAGVLSLYNDNRGKSMMSAKTVEERALALTLAAAMEEGTITGYLLGMNETVSADLAQLRSAIEESAEIHATADDNELDPALLQELFAALEEFKNSGYAEKDIPVNTFFNFETKGKELSTVLGDSMELNRFDVHLTFEDVLHVYDVLRENEELGAQRLIRSMDAIYEAVGMPRLSAEDLESWSKLGLIGIDMDMTLYMDVESIEQSADCQVERLDGVAHIVFEEPRDEDDADADDADADDVDEDDADVDEDDADVDEDDADVDEDDADVDEDDADVDEDDADVDEDDADEDDVDGEDVDSQEQKTLDLTFSVQTRRDDAGVRSVVEYAFETEEDGKVTMTIEICGASPNENGARSSALQFDVVVVDDGETETLNVTCSGEIRDDGTAEYALDCRTDMLDDASSASFSAKLACDAPVTEDGITTTTGRAQIEVTLKPDDGDEAPSRDGISFDFTFVRQPVEDEDALLAIDLPDVRPLEMTEEERDALLEEFVGALFGGLSRLKDLAGVLS